MTQQKTRSTSSPCWISSLSRTFTSGKAGHTVTGTGRKKVAKNTHTANQLQKKCIKRKYKNIHDRFIRDLWFRKTMLELGRSEEVILEMDRLAYEDHTHIATEEEIDVFRGNWWIRSNFVGSDTMPVRHRPDFKKALSTFFRLTKAEDKASIQIKTIQKFLQIHKKIKCHKQVSRLLQPDQRQKQNLNREYSLGQQQPYRCTKEDGLTLSHQNKILPRTISRRK